MDGVTSWFEKRGEIPLAPPPRLREYAPLADDPDHPDDGSGFGSIRGVACALEYCDSHGWVSTRVVRPLSVDTRQPASIRAYCNVRRTTRAFRLDRIVSIFDFRTGLVLGVNAHRALLAPYLPEHVQDPDIVAMKQVMAATSDGVFALLQLAMTDGRLGERERDLILDYISDETYAAGVPLADGSVIELWLDNLSPPLACVTAAVTRLLADKEKFARLLPWLLKVARCQNGSVEQEDSLRELIAEVRRHYRRKLLEWPSHVRAFR